VHVGRVVEGDRGRETGRKGGGRCTGGGRRGVGSGIPKVAGSATLRDILQSKKCKEAAANKYKAGTGNKGLGSGG